MQALCCLLPGELRWLLPLVLQRICQPQASLETLLLLLLLLLLLSVKSLCYRCLLLLAAAPAAVAECMKAARPDLFEEELANASGS